MPRPRSADERRHELGEAVWRVIRRDGLERASVRNVAREAGLSMGSLRHYFGTQSDLLAFSMRLVADRVAARIEALPRVGSSRDQAEEILAELLPLDDERRAEAEVWLSFAGRALVDPGLRALREEVDDALRGLMRDLVAGLLGADAPDAEREAERLYALVDGLALHGVLRPDRLPAAAMTAALAGHLDRLAGGAE
jgi:AcrR family transcriptional regulator